MLPVSAAVSRALEGIQYTAPTVIQEKVIPLVRAGRDVVGQAQTGTGKTAAFGIPLVEAIDRRAREPQVLVLVPTRELAAQVNGELSRLGQFCGIRTLAIFGGRAMSRQLEALHRGVHIVVATPGRLMDHMQRGTIEIGQVKSVVLDEADQMLDIGFAEAINYILRHTPRVPSDPAFLCHYTRLDKEAGTTLSERAHMDPRGWGRRARGAGKAASTTRSRIGTARPLSRNSCGNPGSSPRLWYSAGPRWGSTGWWLTSSAMGTTPRPSTAT